MMNVPMGIKLNSDFIGTQYEILPVSAAFPNPAHFFQLISICNIFLKLETRICWKQTIPEGEDAHKKHCLNLLKMILQVPSAHSQVD